MKYFALVLSLFFINTANVLAGEFLMGAAIEDITGPAAELGMMGYADSAQTTKGIHTRLYARAFVFGDLFGHHPIAYVTADLALISQSVKLAVIDQLKRDLPGVYSTDNVMIAATHTHSGPGGYSAFTLYNLTGLGFDQQNFDGIVDGIARAIQAAHKKRVSGSAFFGEGRLDGATVNRSMQAYRANTETALYADTTNKTMSVLKLVRDDGRELGMLNWFSIHPTSLSKRNRLISSDNKGYPALRFERMKPGLIAGFSNSDEGDVSPNMYDEHWQRKFNDFDGLRTMGELQLWKALEIFDHSNQRLRPMIDFRHAWIRMPGYAVEPEFTGDIGRSLCVAGMGYSFGAGAEDGRAGIAGFQEGQKQEDVEWSRSFLLWLYNVGRRSLLGVTEEDERCQYPKPILINTGRQDPVWTPDTLPFQLFRIGSVVLAALPVEATTMAGRQLRQTILDHLSGIGVERVVLVGLANSYSDYLTTKPEFDLQQYEGASTLFGPYTLAAYKQIFARLADAMRTGMPATLNQLTPNSPDPGITLQTGILYDDKKLWEQFGQVLHQPRNSYRPGETVAVSFRSGHPKNDLKLGDTYLEVQRKVDHAWVLVAKDSDPEAVYVWRRDKSLACLACSVADIYWAIPSLTEPGEYRIVHKGAAKDGWTGKISGFRGTTTSFWVNPP
ncbi:neutral/alkaline ceramidase [Bdellovibrionota bacterium FG-1]